MVNQLLSLAFMGVRGWGAMIVSYCRKDLLDDNFQIDSLTLFIMVA